MRNPFKKAEKEKLSPAEDESIGATIYFGHNTPAWFTNIGIADAVSELNYRWERLSGEEIAKRLSEELGKRGGKTEERKIAQIVYAAHVSEEQAVAWLNGEKIPLVPLCDVCDNSDIYIEDILGKLDKREAKRTFAVLLYLRKPDTYKTVAKTETYEEAKKIFDEYPANEEEYSVYLMDANFDWLDRLYGKNRIIDGK